MKASEQERTSLRSKIGIGFVILAIMCPLIGLVIPLFGLSKATTTVLVAFFMLGGPEVFLILGGFLAGKEGVLLVKNKIKRMLGLPEGRYAATRSQYNLALFIMGLWVISVVLPGYVKWIREIPFVVENMLWISIIGDALFLIALFFIGGNQMITKFGKLLTWEPWQLPPEKEGK